MAIIRHNFTGVFKENEKGYDEELLWQVQCHTCRAKAPLDILPGEAADAARSIGFTTIPRGTNPSLWVCKKCKSS